jgi:UDP-2,3-diacylglucosamine pyrophosphatase LpxH
MDAIIVSDLHIGSRYFLYQAFERFLRNIPEDYELILNGDMIDSPYKKLKSFHQKTLDHIEQISYQHKVVWIKGNHDNGYIPRHLGEVPVKHHYAIKHRLLVSHGDFFDGIMPRSQVFMKVFMLMHNLRVKLGARPIHVAQYAKKWEFLYRVLRKNVMINAVQYARKNGFEAVTCGHTHFAEDIVVDGIRYINTGAWTEYPIFYLQIAGDEMCLKRMDNSVI